MMNETRKISLKRSTRFLLNIFAFILVFFSVSSLKREETFLYNDIAMFFHKGFLSPALFSVFEIILLILLLNILYHYKTNLKFFNGLFLLALLAYALRMFNPNAETTNPVLGMPLFSNTSEYTFLFMLLVFISINAHLYRVIIEKFFKTVLILSLIRAVILLILYAFGQVTTVRWGTFALILDEPDTQFLFSFLGAMLFTKYLLASKIKYLAVSLLFLTICFFSLQRATTMPGIIAVFAISIISLFKGLPVAAARSFVVLTSLALVLTVIVIESPESKLAFAMNRYTGITRDEEEAEQSAFSDTGHREQALLTFYAAWKERTFWGLGYGKADELYLEGQTGNVHNAYAATWATHGIVSLLFYLLVLFITIRTTIKIARKTNKISFRYYLFPLTACLFLLGYFIASWVSTSQILDNIRYQVFYVLIFIYAIRHPIATFDNSGKIVNG